MHGSFQRVVTIAKKAFNDDMDDYLAKLYGKKERYVDKAKKSKKKPVVEKVPEISEEEVYVEYDNIRPGLGFRSWLSSLFQRRIPDDVPENLPPEKVQELDQMEGKIEEVSEEIEELEQRRESLWERFLNSLRWSGRKSEGEMKDELLDEVVPVIDQDVKETLKILHGWLGKLPPHELQAFKRSDDFQRYKAVLEKYGLIKK